MSGSQVLVTGGAGAIGGNLVFTLLARSHRVIVVDDLSSGDRANCPPHDRLEFVEGSILDETVMKPLFQRGTIEVVFHLAAHFANQNSIEFPQVDLETNALGTLKMLDWSRTARVRRFIYTSSSSVYGKARGELHEDAPIQLHTPYAISKWAGEEYVRFYHNYHGLDVVILRLFNAYGPGDPPGPGRNVIPNFLAWAYRGEPLPVMGTGKETRAFTYMEDLVAGIVSASEQPGIGGEVINLGSSREIPIGKLAEMINKLTGNQGGIDFQPRRSWDTVERRKANIAKAQTLLAYNPSTPFEEGLVRTIEWFKSRFV